VGGWRFDDWRIGWSDGSAAWKVILCIADVGSTTVLNGGP